ncbi:hypothetical protein CJJ23_02825 [Mycoplasmopsis agassizii]|uniref:ABC transmembrane type-1 domain-containing protein n=1 Tax=Mycoplasmopsis agassizii TaxID=33922 RepID=A0A269TIP3_9BACT|nr:sugar ABC transporter permease [Mycoplasmopsis agassizii]PAK21257.1 hypothetical protein CJJ23_02825 [Mycoplasmopsis agassizii]
MSLTQDVLKHNFKRTLNSLNPLANSYARSFRIEVKKEIVDRLNLVLRNARAKHLISNNDFFQIVQYLKHNDLKNSATILSQQLAIKKDEDTINQIVLVKLLSLFTSFSPISFSSAKANLKVVEKIKKVITYHVETNLVSYKNVINKFLLSTEKAQEEKQIILNYDLDIVRNYFYNNKINAAKLIEKNLNGFKSFPEEIFVNLAKFEILFHEQTIYLNKKSKYSLSQFLSYDEISKETVRHYELIKEQSNLIKGFNVSEFATHINETSKFIRLSDLPPLTISQIIGMFFSYIILLFWAVAVLLPLVQMIVMSFDGSGGQYLGTTSGFAAESAVFHYQQLFNGQTDFLYWLGNSVLVASLTMILTVIFTLLLAYAFSRFHFKGRRSSIITVMLLQMVPSIAALTAFLVLYQLASIPVWVFLIIIYTGGGLTGNTFILKGYLDSIPVDLDEAARIDGANTFKVFTTIILPLAKPMVAIVALWSFIGPFGDVILPRLLVPATVDGSKDLTMAAGLRTLISGTGSTVRQYVFLAGAIVTGIPLTILFVVAQRFLVSGLTKGAVK